MVGGDCVFCFGQQASIRADQQGTERVVAMFPSVGGQINGSAQMG